MTNMIEYIKVQENLLGVMTDFRGVERISYYEEDFKLKRILEGVRYRI